MGVTAVLQSIIRELVEISEVVEDVDAETDDELSIVIKNDSNEGTLIESFDVTEVTLIKSTEISSVEDTSMEEETTTTDVAESGTLNGPSSFVDGTEATEATEATETTEATEATEATDVTEATEATEATVVESTNQEPIQQSVEAEARQTGFILKKHTAISSQYTAKMPKFEEKLRQFSFIAAHGDQLAENAVEIQLKLAQLKLAEIVSASYSEHDTLKLITACEKNTEDATVSSIESTVTNSSIAIQSDDVCSF